jgi:hypothetical protein
VEGIPLGAELVFGHPCARDLVPKAFDVFPQGGEPELRVVSLQLSLGEGHSQPVAFLAKGLELARQFDRGV